MLNSLQCRRQLMVNGRSYQYFSLLEAEKSLPGISQLPFSLKILLENLLRHEDNQKVTKNDIEAIASWLQKKSSTHEIAFHPTRVLMQDFTGVPAVVDLAAMRTAMGNLHGDPKKINPLCPVDLIIDHSVQVDRYGEAKAFFENVRIEMERNHERYNFLKWGQHAFNNFKVVPPGTGICHQVNLEYLGRTIWNKLIDNEEYAFPDTLVGTDSHTTMINGLGILGWGVGGIEAEAAMLGQPISMLIPEVIGFRLEGRLREGITATDLVLTITEMLRLKGVVGKFVEFYGPGLEHLPVSDRATIANMAPEYGATCGLFPIDHETIKYMELTNRSFELINLIKEYSKAQGMWHDASSKEAIYTDQLTLNLRNIEPSLAGPKRPQDRVSLSELPSTMDNFISSNLVGTEINQRFYYNNSQNLGHGDVVIAAITSCTNTSNPNVMLAAGLLAKKAAAKGLTVKPWVKASLAPGSKVVTDYLIKAGMMSALESLGFFLVGYGCTTCIGNSGPLQDDISKVISEKDLVVSAVLSGNRNFEGRIHPLVKANWLASPPLVVAYALAGTTRIDLQNNPIGKDEKGNPIYLQDIWPSNSEIADTLPAVSKDMFNKEYKEVFEGDEMWKQIQINHAHTFSWSENSTYIKHPPFFENMSLEYEPIKEIEEANILALLGDSVTTDHISPAGSIKANSPAGIYLQEQGVAIKDFNSYGARRGNHEVMIRGTFANIRIRNEIVPGIEGGFTKYYPSEEILSIYDAAMKYKAEGIPLVIFAGVEYGTGSSRDWAAKGTTLLGVKAVIAESFERIHRSNLIGMGVLPIEFAPGENRRTLKLIGSEKIYLTGLTRNFSPKMKLKLTIQRENGSTTETTVQSRIDTENEAEYYLNGGILQYVLRKMMMTSA